MEYRNHVPVAMVQVDADDLSEQEEISGPRKLMADVNIATKKLPALVVLLQVRYLKSGFAPARTSPLPHHAPPSLMRPSESPHSRGSVVFYLATTVVVCRMAHGKNLAATFPRRACVIWRHS